MDDQGITPPYEFGFGLSYTNFTYSSLSISTSGTSQVISFIVANTGSFDGTEIPQLYLGYPASAGEPKKVLRGFEEVALTKGSSSTVSITIKQREMRSVFCCYTLWIFSYTDPGYACFKCLGYAYSVLR